MLGCTPLWCLLLLFIVWLKRMRFEQLSLAVGSKINVTVIGQDYKKHHCEAVLVGYLPGKTVVVTLPNKPPQVLLRAGLNIEANIPLGEGVASFSSRIEGLRDSLVTYLDLEYPAGVHVKTLRSHMRFAVDEPIEVNAHTNLGMTVNAINGYMLDISESGARIVLEKELTAMVTKITLGVYLSSFGLERDITIDAVIRNKASTHPDYPECSFAYGVEYIEFNPIDCYFLQSFCLHHQLRKKQLLCKPE